MKWEYKEIYTGYEQKSNIEDVKNAGLEGWELVSVTDILLGEEVVTSYYFKRPIK